MKRILFISYFFPPLGGPGVQRVQKFAKYLPEFGWEPIVISVKNIEYVAYDFSLLAEMPNIQLHRVNSLDLMRMLYFVERVRKYRRKNKRIYIQASQKIRKFYREIFPIDSKIGWIPFAIHKGKQIIKNNHIKLVFATIGPYSSAIAGYKLAKRFNLPLIIDYRDLWIGKPDITYFSSWHRKFSIYWERKMLKFARLITVNTEFTKDKILSLYSEIENSKFKVIYNGWDREDFSQKYSKENDKIIFTYTGGFYGERTPYYFLKVLEKMLDKNLLPLNIEFRFVGNYFKDIMQMLENKRLRSILAVIPQVTHKKSVKYLIQSDFLMLFIAKKDSEIILPAKIFEYLAARKPILAMIPRNGEAAKTIRENNAGFISEIDEENLIMENILKLLNLYESGLLNTHFRLDSKDYLKYERRNLTYELSKNLDNIYETN